LKLSTHVHFEPTIASQLLALVADVVRWFGYYEWHNFNRRKLNSSAQSSSFLHGTTFQLSPQNISNFDHNYFPKQSLSVSSVSSQFPFPSPLTPISDTDYIPSQNISFPGFSTFSSTPPIIDLFFFLNHNQSSITESQAQFQLTNQQINNDIHQEENQGNHLPGVNHNEEDDDNNNPHDDGDEDEDIDDNDEEEYDDDDTNDLHSSVDHFVNFDSSINFQNNHENSIGDNIQINDVENEIDDADEYNVSSVNDDEINHDSMNEIIVDNNIFVEEYSGGIDEESTNSVSENYIDDENNNNNDDDEEDNNLNSNGN